MEETNIKEAVKNTAENTGTEEKTDTDNKVHEGKEVAEEAKDTEVIKDAEENSTDEVNKGADATPECTVKETTITKKASPLPIILSAVAVVMVAVIIGSVVLVQSFSPEKKSERQCTAAARFLDDLDFEQAVAAYKTAIEIDPNNEAAVQGLYDAYMAWAKSLEDEGNDAEAIKRYEDAIAANPAITDAYYALADLYIRTNNTEALLKLYEKASASLAGEDASKFKSYLLSKLNERITELMADGNTDAAKLFLAALEELDHDLAKSIRDDIVNELLSSGTEENYRKALDIDPKSEAAYLKLIDYYIEKEDYDSAQMMIKDGEDAVGSEEITAQRSEIPYVLANDIIVEDDWIKDIVYDDYTLEITDDDGYKLDAPGLTVDKGDYAFKILSITEETTDDGMKTITILTLDYIQPEFSNTWDGYSGDWYFHGSLYQVGFFDYYSGKIFSSRRTNESESYGVHTELEWKNKTFDIYKETATESDGYWDEETIITSDEGWSEIYSDTVLQTITITVPQDYDGLMIYIEKEAGDCSVDDDYYTDAANKKREEKDAAYLAEEHYLLDPNEVDPDEQYFFRITDESIAEFNK